MKYRLHLYSQLSILFIIVLLASCTSPSRQILKKAGDIMIENPDSASGLIDRINPEKLRSSKEKALYALRMIQARYYSDDSEWANDSLINIALGYYSDHFDDPETAMAYYLGGIINNEQGNRHAAIEYLTEAILAAERHNDVLRISLAHQQLSAIYYYMNQYSAALEHSRKAYDYIQNYNGAKNDIYKADAILQLAWGYYNAHKFDSTLFFLEKRLNYQEPVDPIQEAYIYSLKGNVFFENKKHEDALEFYHKAISINENVMDNGNLLAFGILSLDKGDMAMAFYCDSLLSSRPGGSKVISALMAARHNNYTDAFNIMSKEYEKETFKAFKMRNDTVQSILDPYDKLKNRHASIEADKELSVLYVILVIGGVFYIGLLSLLFFMRGQKARKEMALNKVIANLNRTISDNDIRYQQILSDEVQRHDNMLKEMRSEYERKEKVQRGELEERIANLNNTLGTVRKKLEDVELKNRRYDKIISEHKIKVFDQKDYLLRTKVALIGQYMDKMSMVVNKLSDDSGDQMFTLDDFKSILKDSFKYDNIICSLEEVANFRSNGLVKAFRKTKYGDRPGLCINLIFLILGYKTTDVANFLQEKTNKISKIRHRIKTGLQKDYPDLARCLSEVTGGEIAEDEPADNQSHD